MSRELTNFLLGTIIVRGILFTDNAIVGGFGSRGVKDIYSFNYHGKIIKVQQDDRILGFDKYFICLDERVKMTEGEIVSDEGKIISIDSDHNSYHISGVK